MDPHFHLSSLQTLVVLYIKSFFSPFSSLFSLDSYFWPAGWRWDKKNLVIWSSVHLVFASHPVRDNSLLSVRLDKSIRQGTHSHHHHPSSSRTVSGMAWHIYTESPGLKENEINHPTKRPDFFFFFPPASVKKMLVLPFIFIFISFYSYA